MTGYANTGPKALFNHQFSTSIVPTIRMLFGAGSGKVPIVQIYGIKNVACGAVKSKDVVIFYADDFAN